MSALPPPSSTGVRVAGDLYQWLVVWQGCVTALRNHHRGVTNPVVEVGVEVSGAGNLDDVVLYRATPPHTYNQVKYTVDASTPVNEHYLLATSNTGGPSILRKIADSWASLTRDGSPADLSLISNRAPDPTDPLIAARDSRTGLLRPKAGLARPRSAPGKARARWAAATGLDEAKLLQLLDALRFEIGRDPQHLRELVSLQMLATGLRDDDLAVDSGADWVARQVRDGRRTLRLDAIKNAVSELGLDASRPGRAVLSIATLKPDPLAADADYALDWVDRFDGASAFLKRRPLLPAAWGDFHTELEAIPAHLPVGTTAVVLTGSIRQASAFAIGAALRQVTGVSDLAVKQRGQLWSSDQHYSAPAKPEITEYHLGQGGDLAVAVAVGVAADPTEDVLEYLRAEMTPVGKLLVMTPTAGIRDNAIPDPASAIALTVGIRDHARSSSRHHPRIHLFLAGPMGLAALLGHRWNRLRPTTVYEDVRAQHTYEPAFSVDA